MQWRLTKANYYSDEANRRYMSVSQFKDFLECEAAAKAKLDGRWVPDEDRTALLVGNYLHSYFESPAAHREFIATHPEIISSRGATKGELKREYKIADAMIDSLRDDSIFRELYKGRKEVVMKGTIGGVKWIGKLDAVRPNHSMIMDLKTTQDLHKRYWLDDKNEWGSFVEAFNYPLQMAVYQELSYQRWGIKPIPTIIAVTKQTPPDKIAITLGQNVMNEAMHVMLQQLDRIVKVKNGEVKPARCERCEYCRATKKLSVIDMDDLID